MHFYLSNKTIMARRAHSRRAMNLLEMSVVIAVIGLLAITAGSQYGYSTLGNSNAHGIARKISLALIHARRGSIASGDNHYLQLSSSGGNVTSFALFRRTSGGDLQVDQSRLIPDDVLVTSSASTLEFDFEGSALGTYSISVVGPNRSWQLTVNALTGLVQVAESTH